MLGVNAHLMHGARQSGIARQVATRRNMPSRIIGNWYGCRQSSDYPSYRGADVPLSLYGSTLPRWSLPGIRSAHCGRYVVKEEKSKVFGEALACLNSFSPAEGDSLNCRAFGSRGLPAFNSSRTGRQSGSASIREANPSLFHA